MGVRAEVHIRAPRAAVWDVVSDIENAADAVTSIRKVEVLERPTRALVGLKWRETRTMFGKEATEVMWVTDAAPRSHYETRAESHGSIYKTWVRVEDHDGGTRLSMEFEGRPVTWTAKVMWGLMGFLFKGATRKALQKDLDDVKAAVESRTGARA